MASSSSSFLLAVVALVALFVVGSCETPLIFTIGGDTTATKLCLDTNVPITEVSIKPKGATDFSEDLKVATPTTFIMESKEPIEGPISVRWAAKAGGYRVKDNAIPKDFKAGAEYNSGETV